MLRIATTTRQTQKRVKLVVGSILLGRESQADEPCLVLDDPFVSRRHLRVEPRQDGQILLTNVSSRMPVMLDATTTLAPGESISVASPTVLTMGESRVVLELVETAQDDSLHAWQTIQIPTHARPDVPAVRKLINLDESLTPETLAHWFETVISVQRAAAGSSEFFQETVRAVVNLVGLDCCWVLLLQAEGDRADPWEVAAFHSAGVPAITSSKTRQPRYSRSLLARVAQERRTFYQDVDLGPQTTVSLQIAEAVVASPIFNEHNEVVGAVYGLRLKDAGAGGLGIRPLEAQVVQLLAAAVGAGLIRQQREAEAARSRIQFEQFFSPQLADRLQRDPRLLEGRDREVTILFADLCDFARLSERLGPAETFRLVGDVLDCWTNCVVETEGMVDYVGDGLLAMWNAPEDHADHAQRACLTALAMYRQMPRINAIWEKQLGRPMQMGVGINTGMARVGNTGSQRRFKYGPLGHAVNLASRVQDATRKLGVPMLLTRATLDRMAKDPLMPPLATRRLCQAALQGIHQPVELFELWGGDQDDAWRELCAIHQAASQQLEAGDWRTARKTIWDATQRLPWLAHDLPSQLIVKRAEQAALSPTKGLSAVLRIDKHSE